MTQEIQQNSIQLSDSSAEPSLPVQSAAEVHYTEEHTSAVLGPYEVPARFQKQLENMPDSIREPLENQLTLMPDSAVFEIYESGHKTSILYKTNAQSHEASARQDSINSINGGKANSLAKSKIGSEYITTSGDIQQFTIARLIEFQITGLLVVMLIIIFLTILTYFVNFIVKKFSQKEKPSKSESKQQQAGIPHSSKVLDPNAPSVHPGFTNKQLQAFLSIAAVSALDIHPGLTNDQLAVIFAAAAADILNGPCRVVKFKSQKATEWIWTSQGRAELNSNGLNS